MPTYVWAKISPQRPYKTMKKNDLTAELICLHRSVYYGAALPDPVRVWYSQYGEGIVLHASVRGEREL